MTSGVRKTRHGSLKSHLVPVRTELLFQRGGNLVAVFVYELGQIAVQLRLESLRQ
jgi:hypothetical protein